MEKTIDKESDPKGAVPKNGLGISRSVYALGESFEKALIWGTVATVVSWFAMAFAKKLPGGPTVLEYASKANKAWQAHPVGRWYDKNIAIRLKGPIIAASMGIGYLVGHLASIPGGALGWRRADAAITKYDTLHDEKEQLVKTNQILMDDNQKLKAALAGADENRLPMTERVRNTVSGQPGLGA